MSNCSVTGQQIDFDRERHRNGAEEDQQYQIAMYELHSEIEEALRAVDPREAFPPRSLLTSGELQERLKEVHTLLKPLLDEYRETKDVSLFEPGSITNRAFGQLCNLSIGYYAEGVLEEAIATFPKEVQADIREMCYLGEAQMERYFVERTLDWVSQDKDSAFRDIKERAEAALASQYSQEELSGDSWEVQTARRVERLRALLTPPNGGFPYFDNYLKIVTQGEAQIVLDLLHDSKVEQPVLTFAGSGSLDLTSDFMLMFLGGEQGIGLRVNSIDIDPIAYEVSTRLTRIKEELDILPVGGKTTLLADATTLRYGGTQARQGEEEIVDCDVLFIASMIPHGVRETILKNLSSEEDRPVPGVMIRDAYGLVGHLLYPKVEQEMFSRHGFDLWSACHPVHQMLNGIGPVLPSPHNRPVSAEILNSTWGGTNRALMSA